MIRLLSDIALTDQVKPATLAAPYSKNTMVAISATILAFAPNDYVVADGGTAYFIANAQEVEVDAAADTYAVGDLVYDANPTPTGIVNKTSGAGRQAVGKVIQAVTLGAQGKLVIKFQGGL